MTLRRTAHLHEFLDDTGRRFVVRLNVGMPVGVVQSGPCAERIDWQAGWGVYRPQSEATAQRLVAVFLSRQEHRQGVEHVNDELIVAGRVPIFKRPVDVHERQLPVSDRA